jgi:hypothetical protein
MSALREFVADLLDREGALVEPVEPDGLEVMAPEPLRAALGGWPELARLGFGAQRQAGALAVGLEGDWLDRFGALLGPRGRLAECQLVLPAPAAPGDAERRLEAALDLGNAIWRLRGAAPAWTRCVLLTFRYTATSDERREGLIQLGFNAGTGALLAGDLVERLRRALSDAPAWASVEAAVRAQAGGTLDAELLAGRVRGAVDMLVRSDLEPFLRAMRRRLDRDSARVHAYHDDLRRAALAKLAALQSAAGGKLGDKAEAGRKREAMRVAAIEREYATKLDDLRHNYALRVTVDWVQALTVFAPVQRYEVLIKRRKGERLVTIDWHPAARLMEPPLCEWGTGLERTRLVCDEHLHLTDPDGQAPCPSCGKGWCRACHGALCPRCRRAARTNGLAACARSPASNAPPARIAGSFR